MYQSNNRNLLARLRDENRVRVYFLPFSALPDIVSGRMVGDIYGSEEIPYDAVLMNVAPDPVRGSIIITVGDMSFDRVTHGATPPTRDFRPQILERIGAVSRPDAQTTVHLSFQRRGRYELYEVHSPEKWRVVTIAQS